MKTKIENVRIFDGDAAVLENSAVLFDESGILAVGAAAAAAAADRTVDGTGKTLLPGLIDCHVHLGSLGAMDAPDDPMASAAITAAASSGRIPRSDAATGAAFLPKARRPRPSPARNRMPGPPRRYGSSPAADGPAPRPAAERPLPPRCAGRSRRPDRPPPTSTWRPAAVWAAARTVR